MLIVETKPNLSKTILKRVLGQQLELTGVALTHKGTHFLEHDGGSWTWSNHSSMWDICRNGKAVVSVKIGQCSDRKDGRDPLCHL
jgi:hypothetical protein